LEPKNLHMEFDICSLFHRDFSTSITKILSILYLKQSLKEFNLGPLLSSSG